MGWWWRLLGTKRETVDPFTLVERRDGSLEQVILASLGEARTTASGVAVSEEGALHNTAVLACVRILANSVAMLPQPVYRRLPRGKVRAPSHPLYPILQERANPEMTAFELRRWLMQCVLLWGTGYAEIEWSAQGADVYSAAADREQAAIVFEMAKQMVELSPLLRQRAELFKRSIFCAESMSGYKVLSADAYTKHGLNPHGIIFDELHAQPNCDLWDVLNTGMGNRRQPLMVMITTAGYDLTSICWEQRESEEEPYWWLPFFWVPEQNLVERARRDRVPYVAWRQQGLVSATPGNVIDYEVILETVKRLGSQYRIGEIAFDRWGATRISTQLTDAGFTMVEFGQGYASMSAPSKELLQLVLAERMGVREL